MTPINAKLLIFDLDGTLADTISAITDGMNLALDECGLPRRSVDHVRRSLGDGARMLCRRMLPPELFNDDALTDCLLETYNRTYGLTYMNTRENYTGISETVRELKRRGYILAVLSNKQDVYVKNMISSLFPEGEFSLSFGNTPERHRKPDPAGAIELCRALGISPEDAVMIGDGETDVRAAQNAGFAANVTVTWGYRPIDLLRSCGADIFVDRPEELLELFQ